MAKGNRGNLPAQPNVGKNLGGKNPGAPAPVETSKSAKPSGIGKVAPSKKH